MAWDSDDLAVFFDADMPATKTATIGAASVAGTFRAAYASVMDGLVGGSSPTFRAATADLVGVDPGDVIEVDGTSYTVDEVDASDLGHTLLRLSS